MKTLLAITFLFCVSFAFGQKMSKPKYDSIVKEANPIQLQRLQETNEKITKEQKNFNEYLEFIFGVKMEDIESWEFKNGRFIARLKPKK